MYQFMSDFDRSFGFPDLSQFFRQFDRVVGAFDQEAPASWRARRDAWVSETDDGYQVVAELPGVKEDDVEVTLREGVLTIRAKRQLTAPEGYEKGRRERADFDFSRSYRLSGSVDGKRIEAKLVNGLLTVALPKQEPAKPRQIAVKAS